MTQRNDVVDSQATTGMTSVRWLIALLVTIFIYLQFKLWVGDGSYSEVHRLNDAIGQQQLENQKAIERNLALSGEVKDLRQGLTAVEERARNELGMIKQGETFFQIVGQK